MYVYDTKEQHCQQVKGGDPVTLFSPGEATSGVSSPGLHSTTETWTCWSGSSVGYKDYEGFGASHL